MGMRKAGISFFRRVMHRHGPPAMDSPGFVEKPEIGGGFRSLERDRMGYKTVMVDTQRIIPETARGWERVRLAAGNRGFDAIEPGIESPICGSSHAAPRFRRSYTQPTAGFMLTVARPALMAESGG